MARALLHPESKPHPRMSQVTEICRGAEIATPDSGPPRVHQPRDWPGVQECPAHHEHGDFQEDLLLRCPQ